MSVPNKDLQNVKYILTSQEENKKLLKEELYRIYRLETNKEPLDRFGNETLDYKQWETNYLIMIGETL